MAVTISEAEVVKQVRINLDEIANNDSEFSPLTEKDEAELDTIIKQKMGEAYRYVMTNAHPELLDASLVTIVNATAISGTKNMKSELTDFLRFVWANAKDWPYPVFKPIFWNTEEYAELYDAHTTGTKERPKVGISPSFDSNKKMVVTLYGAESNGVIGYIKELDSSSSSTTTLTDTLYTAYLYYITSLVLLTLRESQHAENMLGQALATLRIDTSQKTK